MTQQGPQRKRRYRPPADPGSSYAAEQVRATLWKFRREHGWEPGMVWDAATGKYVPGTYARGRLVRRD